MNSGNGIYRDYNDKKYRLVITIEEDTSGSNVRYIEFTVRIFPDCSDLTLDDTRIIEFESYLPLADNTK